MAESNIDNNVILEFLALYERYSEIWDPKNANQKNRNIVSDAWNKIQREMSVNISIENLKKKKESLMTTYRNLKKKVAASDRSGASKDDVFKPSWFAYEVMDNFLSSTGKIRATLDTEQSTPRNGSDQETQDEDLSTHAVSQESSKSIVDADEALTLAQVQDTSSAPTGKRNTVKRKLSVVGGIEDSMKQAAKALEAISQKRPASHEQKQMDECSLYGELLATRLRTLNYRTRKIVINSIDNLVFKAEMGELNENISSQYTQQSSSVTTLLSLLSSTSQHSEFSPVLEYFSQASTMFEETNENY